MSNHAEQQITSERLQLHAEDRLNAINAEIDRRINLLQTIEANGAEALAMEIYAQDPVNWINDWCWTYDPRNPAQGLPAYLPMRLFPRQEEWVLWTINRIENGENGWTPKSRGTGVSYCAVDVGAWMWRFRNGVSGSYVSMKEEEVDSKNDPDSLFQKIRIVLGHLPQWMLPEGFELGGEHDNHRRIHNPENGNTLTGDIGSNAGRGGRKTFTFIDEAAHVANLGSARRALYNATDCLIEISTPNGTGEPFYQSVQEGGEQVFWFPWSDVPWYTDEWYAKMREKYRRAGDMAGFAQEVDMNFAASIDGLVIEPEWVEAARKWRPSEDYEPDEHAYGFDVADGGADSSVLTHRHGIVIKRLYTRKEGGTTKTARWARGVVEANHAEVKAIDVVYDADGIGASIGDAWAEDEQPPKFKGVAFNGGASPTKMRWPNKKSSKDRFINLKAETWWLVRERFRKTYERWLFDNEMEGGEHHPDDECICLEHAPKDLVLQLSQPRYEYKAKNKIAIESKDSLAKRGIKSPDYADSLVMSFMPRIKYTWNM